MPSPLRLLGVFAHPDDESLGMGATIARYAAEGVDVSLVCATRGQRGRCAELGPNPPMEVVGRIREAELRAAARLLGVRSVSVLNYMDGELDHADSSQVIAELAWELRLRRPQVVATFAPDGAYGHPDHIAISQFTTAAVVAASDPTFGWESGWPGTRLASHRTAKLYYLAWGMEKWATYQNALKKLVSHVDGVERQAAPWPEWAITTRIDATSYWERAWAAVRCHVSQLSVYRNLEALAPEVHRELWGRQEFYRAFSLVNGGRGVESDLFEGLRIRKGVLANVVCRPDAIPAETPANMEV